MGQPVHRQNDLNTGNGVLLEGANSVLVNNLPISVDGKPVSDHFPLHSGVVTANGLKNVIAEYIPVNVRGNLDTCGHPRADGSPNVMAGE